MSALRMSLTVMVVGLIAMSACGDDANDHGLQRQRAAQRAAELRQSSIVEAADAADAADAAEPEHTGVVVDSTAASEPSETVGTTTVAVVPTGVVIPVQAIDNTFRPQIVEIQIGDEVLWENRGLNDHDVLYVDGDDWGIEVEGFGPGAAYAHIFTEPGEYRYYCSIHGNESVGMTGTIVVSG